MNFFDNQLLNKIDKQNWQYYQKVLKKEITDIWDYIVITAANEKQKIQYEKEIEKRKQEGYLPDKIKFIVITDFKEKRVGSGGATLNVLQYMKLKEKDFEEKKTLIIHSGGDSKRILQYSLIGKLFMPIQRILPDGRASSLFDEIFLSFIVVPSKINCGIFISSGDVWLLFDSFQMDLKKEKIAAISSKTQSEKGTKHGVFLIDEDKNLVKFLHKQSECNLEKARCN